MGKEILLLLQILFPVAAGCLLFVLNRKGNRKIMITYTVAVLVAETLLVCSNAVMQETVVECFYITPAHPMLFCNDGLSGLFSVLVSVVWLLVGIYSVQYLKETRKPIMFYGFYLISLGVLQGLSLAGNLVTFYLFYEWMTLMTVPLVFYNRTKEAGRAARKYLFYSVAGASLSLAGMFLLAGNTEGLLFTGSALNSDANRTTVLLAALLLVLGFGTKAGMFPMHGWLPTAHPVAPAPASAVLSGIITKAGVLGIVRSLYYVIGMDYLKGTYVQIVFLTLSLITVFMGSMLAYKEKILKKRLAYSTVSQVSYVLFGLALFTPAGFAAALLHVVFHSVIKNGLFLFAGTVIHQTGEERVEGLKGMGKDMPVTFWCFTFASLALVGIPPLSGFVSKWYLAKGALEASVGAFSYIGPAVLLVSALLTAGYLLSITADGFFPGKNFTVATPEPREAQVSMLIPCVIFAVTTVGLGVFASPLYTFVTNLAAGLLR
ncbi:MAG: proton-conducting membrane transporter [Lachnospiraceae bacterium]|nr:proton-conducting membrane transporter [Lachnospiraceae bacterium]